MRADGLNRTGRGPTRRSLRTCWTRGSDGYAPHTHPADDLTYVRVGGQAAEEGARVPEPLHHDRAAEA